MGAITIKEDRIKDNYLITLMNPGTIEQDWKQATELWYMKYNRRDATISDELSKLCYGKSIEDFWSYWKRQNGKSYIDWVFPCGAPTKLSIRAYQYALPTSRLYLVYDRASKSFCVDGNGSPHILLPLDKLSVPDLSQRGR